nr:histidine phosphatase family protein [Bacilli bacterium]
MKIQEMIAITYLFLLRHGQTDWNKEGRLQGQIDTPLNETGLSQVDQFVAYYAKEPWDFIVTSPLLRAKQTALRIASQRPDLRVVEDNTFIERDFGRANGLNMAQIQERFPDRIYPDAEDVQAFHDRSFKAIHALAQRHQNRRILVVTHGAVINSILKSLSGGMHGTGITTLQNTGVTRVMYDNQAFSLLSISETQHLQDV